MAVGATGLSELLVVLALLFGGPGIPLGMPPLPPDPFMDGIAPEKCLVYSSWNGMAVPSADSENETERLLAEPEIQEFIKRIERTVRMVIAKEAAGHEERMLVAQTVPDLVKLLLTQPTSIYVSNVGVGPKGPIASGAIVVKGDTRLAATFSRLRRLFAMNRDAETDEMEIRSTKFYRIAMGEPLPPIYMGTHQGYLIISTGDGSAHKLMSRIGKDAPLWLVEARESLPVKRRSTISYLDVTRLRALGKQFGGLEVAAVIQGFGLDDIQSVISTSGLDGKGSIQTIHIKTDANGRLKKLLGSFKPLTAQDFANIPPDAAFANVANINFADVLDFAKESLGSIDPSIEQMFEESLKEIERELGFNPRSDLAEALGDRWSVYASPDTGLFTGVVLSVEVDDFQKLNRVLFSLVGMAKGIPDFGVTSHNVDGVTVYTLVFDEPVPFSPSFCLTGKDLLISMFPQPIRAHLTRPAGKTLASLSTVASHLENDNPPSGMMYVDTKRLVELTYPMIQIGYSMFCNVMKDDGVDLDPAILPTPGSILRHVDASITSVAIVDDGIVLNRRQQFPSGSLGATAAFALGVSLPAVGAARDAARRTASANNLKQIGLAYHNYHDTFRAFPGNSYDADGKPLLSWRVHILPFVEQQALYEQFRLDEPWDSEHNKTLIDQMPIQYVAPGSRLATGKTVYQAPLGKNTIMPPLVKDAKIDVNQKFPLGVAIRSVTDGTSNTIMMLETSEDVAVTWTKPDDYEVDPKDPTASLVGLRRNGFQAGFCDGSVRFISEFIDVPTLNSLFTRNGGEPIDRTRF